MPSSGARSARTTRGASISAPPVRAFTYSLTTGEPLVATGVADHALVVGADVMSSIIDYTDRSTCILFGDGAGAVVDLAAADRRCERFIDFLHEIDGSGGAALCMPAGGSRQPRVARERRPAPPLREAGRADGLQVRGAQDRRDCAPPAHPQRLRPADLDLFVSHQANRRIIEAAARTLGSDPDKVVINISGSATPRRPRSHWRLRTPSRRGPP